MTNLSLTDPDEGLESMRRIIRSVVVAGAFAAGLAAVLVIASHDAARSAERLPALRSVVTVASDVVTLGDLFDNAGALSETAVFRAPDLGQTGTIEAWKVIDAARAAGMAKADGPGVVDVVVTHEAREIASDEVMKALADAAAKQMPGVDLADLQFSLDQSIEPHLADARAQNPIKVASFSQVPATGRFDALVLIETGGAADKLRLRGTVSEVVEVVMLGRQLNRGDVVARDDIVVEKLPKRQAGAFRLGDPQQIVGMAAKRQLRVNQPVILSDFTPPVLVQRGEIVSLVFEAPGLVLSARGQALESGAKGDSVTILNQQSKRVVHGVVAGQGKVLVSPGPSTVASLGGATQ